MEMALPRVRDSLRWIHFSPENGTLRCKPSLDQITAKLGRVQEREAGRPWTSGSMARDRDPVIVNVDEFFSKVSRPPPPFVGPSLNASRAEPASRQTHSPSPTPMETQELIVAHRK